MKRVTFKSVMILLGILMLTVGCWYESDSDCTDYTSTEENSVKELVEQYLSPSMTSVQEALIFRNNLVQEYTTNEIFMDLPDEVITNVVTVLLKSNKTVTQYDIVTEYLVNKTVYDGLLPQAPPVENKDTTQANSQPIVLPPSTVDYHYEIDTVDGKPIRVLVKEERYAGQ